VLPKFCEDRPPSGVSSRRIHHPGLAQRGVRKGWNSRVDPAGQHQALGLIPGRAERPKSLDRFSREPLWNRPPELEIGVARGCAPAGVGLWTRIERRRLGYP